MSVQKLIASAINSGFTIADFKFLTIGMICDALSEFIPEEQRVYEATTSDIKMLLG